MAITPGVTQGRIRTVAADIQRNLWFVVERDNALGTDLYLERLDDNVSLDAAVTVTGAPMIVVPGLDHLEGLSVYAYADRELVGPCTVRNGAITLDTPASSITAGLASTVSIKTLPIREKLQNTQPFKPPCRVYEAELTSARRDRASSAPMAAAGSMCRCPTPMARPRRNMSPATRRVSMRWTRPCSTGFIPAP